MSILNDRANNADLQHSTKPHMHHASIPGPVIQYIRRHCPKWLCGVLQGNDAVSSAPTMLMRSNTLTLSPQRSTLLRLSSCCTCLVM